MCIDRIVNAMAGTFILLSLGLGVEASPVFHSAAIILKKLGARPGVAFD